MGRCPTGRGENRKHNVSIVRLGFAQPPIQSRKVIGTGTSIDICPLDPTAVTAPTRHGNPGCWPRSAKIIGIDAEKRSRWPGIEGI